MPWLVILGLIRIATNPKIARRPLSAADACGRVEEWLNFPHVRLAEPASAHLARLRTDLERTGATGNLIMDAHLAGIALEQGAVLCSADQDFVRFPGLRWMNPLAPKP